MSTISIDPVLSPARRPPAPLSSLPATLRTAPGGAVPRLFRVAFAPHGRLLAAGGDDGRVVVWDLPSGQQRSRWQAHPGSVRDLAFSPDGTALATAGGDWLRGRGELRLWDADSAAEREMLWRDSRPVTALAFSPDGQILAAGGGGGALRAWRTAGWRELCQAGAHTDEILSLRFSGDNELLATASADRTVRLWAGPELTSRQTLSGHTDVVWDVAFSEEGWLASAGADRSVKLWFPGSEQEWDTLAGQEGAVRAVVFAPGGRLLLAASVAREGAAELRSWDPATRSHRACARLATRLYGLAFSPDGQTLAAAAGDGSVRLWSWRFSPF